LVCEFGSDAGAAGGRKERGKIAVMGSKKRNKIILEGVCELLEKMNVKVNNVYVEDGESEANLKIKNQNSKVKNGEEEMEQEEAVLVGVEVENPGVLIGFKGRNLAPLQLIMSLMVKNKLGKWVRVLMDVNNYRQEQKERLEERVREAVKKVKDDGEAVSLGQMTSYERRICHMAVGETEGVASESEGEGVYRHVVIKPRGL